MPNDRVANTKEPNERDWEYKFLEDTLLGNDWDINARPFVVVVVVAKMEQLVAAAHVVVVTRPQQDEDGMMAIMMMNATTIRRWKQIWQLLPIDCRPNPRNDSKSI